MKEIARYTMQINVGLKDNAVSVSTIIGLLRVAVLENSNITTRFFDSEWNGEPEQVLFVEFGIRNGEVKRCTIDRLAKVSTICNQDCIAVKWRGDELMGSRLIYREDWKGEIVEFDEQYFKAPK